MHGFWCKNKRYLHNSTKKRKQKCFLFFCFYTRRGDVDLNFLTKRKIVTQATIDANPSDTGIADHAPVTPKKRGKISKQGIKNKNCRVRLRNIETLALPMDWKKLVITICEPIMGNMITDI